MFFKGKIPLTQIGGIHKKSLGSLNNQSDPSVDPHSELKGSTRVSGIDSAGDDCKTYQWDNTITDFQNFLLQTAVNDISEWLDNI